MKKTLVFPFVFLGFLSQAVFNQDKISDWFSVSKFHSVGQTFTASDNNLYKIRLFARNPQLANRKEIIFKLKESLGSTRNIIEVKLNGLNIGWDYSLDIIFPKIKDSKEKNYYFFLESGNSEEIEAIVLGYEKKDNYPNGQAYLGNDPQSGDLYFFTFYKNPPLEILGKEITNSLSHLTKDPGFLIFYLILLLATSVLALTLKSTRHFDPERSRGGRI